MATGYFSHPDCLSHEMGAGHPECPQRIRAIEDQLRAQGLDALMQHEDVPMVAQSDLALAHDLIYVLTLDDSLQQLEETGDTRVAGCWSRGGCNRCRDRRSPGKRLLRHPTTWASRAS